MENSELKELHVALKKLSHVIVTIVTVKRNKFHKLMYIKIMELPQSNFEFSLTERH